MECQRADSLTSDGFEPSDLQRFLDEDSTDSPEGETGEEIVVYDRLESWSCTALAPKPLPLGSMEAAELEKDTREAKVSLDWMMRHHSEWIDTVAVSSGISTEAYMAIMLAYLIDKGKAAVAGARCAVQSYEKWAEENKEHVFSAYPPTEAKVALYFRCMTAAARQRAERLERDFKGTAAHGRATHLKASAMLYGSPFGFIKESDFANVATRAPEMTSATRDEAHQGVFSVCHYEQIANSTEHYQHNHTVWLYACAFTICAHSSIRSIEGARARATELTPDYLELHVTGGKASVKIMIRPFTAWIPTKGCLGECLWMKTWFEEMHGKPYIFPKFEAERGHAGDPKHARALRHSQVATVPAIESAWHHMSAEEPLSYSIETQVELRATSRGARHFHPDIARTGGYPREDRKELGRWAIPLDLEEDTESQKSRLARRACRAACPELYSSGNAARDRQLSVRTAILDDVRAYIGAREWTAVVPRQEDEKPSFGYLYHAHALPPSQDEAEGPNATATCTTASGAVMTYTGSVEVTPEGAPHE